MIKKIILIAGFAAVNTSGFFSQDIKITKTNAITKEPTIIYSDPNASNYRIIPDVEPVFPGGPTAMSIFVSKNLKYPRDAVNHNIQGLLLARLTITKEGTAKFEEFFRKLGYGCEEEVQRIIKKMPKWTPAMLGDRPVESEYVLKVNFKLSN
ncbi:energy transducer TonB [Chryseobacterium indoltheticum]|uniref:energy transducer TonB n=1 Tax=Chryseobacterium indoltheticum TaxID=254 RepID=UPI001913D283|nr:energy transducer TonB [Chryseobacterium indoltheticum]QQQ29162.1 energy transducer TonB [Chryseobacterium indoltheticum]